MPHLSPNYCSTKQRKNDAVNYYHHNIKQIGLGKCYAALHVINQKHCADQEPIRSISHSSPWSQPFPE